MIKTGLVLEGGAMRGIFSAGIMDVLMENGIRFDGIIGVSAGAAFGCNYKSGQIGRVIRYNKRFCRDKRYCSWQSWWKTGDRDPAEFYLVCTDVHTGRAHYQACPRVDADCFEWMRASASMPLVSRVVQVGGGEYLDGAIADSIPLRFFESIGYERNVVILTQPAGFVKKDSKAMWLLKWALCKYPALLDALQKRQIVYNETLEYVEKQAEAGKIFLFRPDLPLPVKRICHDPDILQQTYEIGRAKAGQELLRLKQFLARKGK